MNAKQRILIELCKAWPTSIRLIDLISFGGTSADRRLRDLRNKHGIDIDYYYEMINGKKTKTTRYLLLEDPAKIDIENLCLRS